VLVGLNEILQVGRRDPSLHRNIASLDPLQQGDDIRLEVDDQVGLDEVVRHRLVQLVVDDQFLVIEVQAGEQLVLLQQEIRDDRGGTGRLPRQLPHQRPALGQKKELGLERGARLSIIEGGDVGIFPRLVQHRPALKFFRQSLGQSGFPHADGPFDDEVLEIHNTRKY